MNKYSGILTNKLIQNYFKVRINSVKNPNQVLFKPNSYQVVFILSHMRSGSSLFTHILSSNPEIIGYGETHLQYNSEQSIKELINKVYLTLRQYNMNHNYVLDKLLHNNKLLNTELLKSPQLSTLFLLREPQRTLASICDLKLHWTQEQALQYYCDRLSTLEQYAQYINDRNKCLFITYDQLIHQTPLIFNKLQDFLKVNTPFSESYQVRSTTGVKGIGDSSENITKGTIIRKARPLNTQISPEVLNQGKIAFEHCHKTLSEYCQSIE